MFVEAHFKHKSYFCNTNQRLQHMHRICARNLVCRHKQRKAKIILILDPRSTILALSRRDPNNAWSANEQAVGLVSQSASQLLEMLSKQNEDPLVSSIDRESFPRDPSFGAAAAGLFMAMCLLGAG